MDQRQAYLERYRHNLTEYDAQINRLESRMGTLDADSQARYQAQLDEARRKCNDCRSFMEKLSDASNDAWDEMKEEAEEAWNSFKSTVEDVKRKLH